MVMVCKRCNCTKDEEEFDRHRFGRQACCRDCKEELRRPAAASGLHSFSLELRPGVVVRFRDLPAVLERSEADKLRRIVLAYVDPAESASSGLMTG